MPPGMKLADRQRDELRNNDLLTPHHYTAQKFDTKEFGTFQLA